MISTTPIATVTQSTSLDLLRYQPANRRG